MSFDKFRALDELIVTNYLTNDVYASVNFLMHKISQLEKQADVGIGSGKLGFWSGKSDTDQTVTISTSKVGPIYKTIVTIDNRVVPAYCHEYQTRHDAKSGHLETIGKLKSIMDFTNVVQSLDKDVEEPNDFIPPAPPKKAPTSTTLPPLSQESQRLKSEFESQTADLIRDFTTDLAKSLSLGSRADSKVKALGRYRYDIAIPVYTNRYVELKSMNSGDGLVIRISVGKTGKVDIVPAAALDSQTVKRVVDSILTKLISGYVAEDTVKKATASRFTFEEFMDEVTSYIFSRLIEFGIESKLILREVNFNIQKDACKLRFANRTYRHAIVSLARLGDIPAASVMVAMTGEDVKRSGEKIELFPLYTDESWAQRNWSDKKRDVGFSDIVTDATNYIIGRIKKPASIHHEIEKLAAEIDRDIMIVRAGRDDEPTNPQPRPIIDEFNRLTSDIGLDSETKRQKAMALQNRQDELMLEEALELDEDAIEEMLGDDFSVAHPEFPEYQMKPPTDEDDDRSLDLKPGQPFGGSVGDDSAYFNDVVYDESDESEPWENEP